MHAWLSRDFLGFLATNLMSSYSFVIFGTLCSSFLYVRGWFLWLSVSFSFGFFGYFAVATSNESLRWCCSLNKCVNECYSIIAAHISQWRKNKPKVISFRRWAGRWCFVLVQRLLFSSCLWASSQCILLFLFWTQRTTDFILHELENRRKKAHYGKQRLRCYQIASFLLLLFFTFISVSRCDV